MVNKRDIGFTAAKFRWGLAYPNLHFKNGYLEISNTEGLIW